MFLVPGFKKVGYFYGINIHNYHIKCEAGLQGFLEGKPRALIEKVNFSAEAGKKRHFIGV